MNGSQTASQPHGCRRNCRGSMPLGGGSVGVKTIVWLLECGGSQTRYTHTQTTHIRGAIVLRIKLMIIPYSTSIANQTFMTILPTHTHSSISLEAGSWYNFHTRRHTFEALYTLQVWRIQLMTSNTHTHAQSHASRSLPSVLVPSQVARHETGISHPSL